MVLSKIRKGTPIPRFSTKDSAQYFLCLTTFFLSTTSSSLWNAPSLQPSPIVPDTVHSAPSPCLLPGRRRNSPCARHTVASSARSGSPEWSGHKYGWFLPHSPDCGRWSETAGNHRVHAGIVLNGQVPADILQIGIIGRCRTYAESPASGTSGLRPSFSQHSAYSWSILLARANALPHSRHLQTGFDFLGKKYSSAISQLTALKTNVRRTAFCHRTLGSVASHDGVFYYNITN